MVTRKSEGPTQMPARPEFSAQVVSEAPGTTEPRPLTTEMIADLTARAAVEMAPVMLPPGIDEELRTEAAARAQEAAIGIWRQNVMVTALWSINETRNAFIHLQNIGWRRIFNGRDGSFSTLVALASQAKQTNRPVTAREAADGMINEIYLW